MIEEVLKRKLIISKAYIDDICLGLLHLQPNKRKEMTKNVLNDLEMKYSLNSLELLVELKT